MNRHSWACGFVLLAAISANAQDLSEISRENLDIALNPPVPIVELLRQAEAGDKYAQHSVAKACAADGAVPKNDAEAVRWCLHAARNGIASAQNSMGYRYEHGLEVPQDHGEAVRLFSSAAEQKFPPTQYNLARMYQYRYGVPQD